MDLYVSALRRGSQYEDGVWGGGRRSTQWINVRQEVVTSQSVIWQQVWRVSEVVSDQVVVIEAI